MRETLHIHRPEGRGRRVRKSRDFRATLLAIVTANHMWQLGSSGTARRPVWLCYAGTPAELRSFGANLRGGLAALQDYGGMERGIECPKSACYRWLSEEHEGVQIVTGFLPEIFHLEPAVLPEDVRCIVMPPRWWVDSEAAKLRGRFGERAEDAVRATLCAAYLDRRIQVPMMNDPAFHLALYDAMRKEGLWEPASDRHGESRVQASGIEECGLHEPLAIQVSHEVLEQFLAEQVKRFYASRVRREEARAPIQLTLNFEAAAA